MVTVPSAGIISPAWTTTIFPFSRSSKGMLTSTPSTMIHTVSGRLPKASSNSCRERSASLAVMLTAQLNSTRATLAIKNCPNSIAPNRVRLTNILVLTLPFLSDSKASLR